MNGRTCLGDGVWVYHDELRSCSYGRCYLHGWTGRWRHLPEDADRDARKHLAGCHE